VEVLKNINQPVILLGGKEDEEMGNAICNETSVNVLNACGKYNLNQSASLVKQAKLVITNDTGLMHIAAVFKKEIISLWGNTVPEFGMYPYLEKSEVRNQIIETRNLDCRPCSKIGYDKCPKGHFDCMQKISSEKIWNAIAS
jgi:heptosyltransferase-2